MVSIMGGSYTGIGIRHFFAAEFNFFVDSYAAKIVIAVILFIIQAYNNVILSTFDFVLDLDTNISNRLFLNDKT